MGRIWRYIAVPVAAFVIGLIFFSRVLNQGISDPTMEMSPASLPVVYMVYDGQRINEMHGYTTEMDATSMRDTVTPVRSGDMLPISIDTYGNKITSVTYEVRSLDTSHLVQESEAVNLTENGDVVTADLPIQNLLTLKEEYLLILNVSCSGEQVYFYTRIVEENTSDIEESVAFVRDFHKVTMNKTRQEELVNYMETTSGQNNRNLHSITLKNSLSQVCWGDFRGTEVTEPILSIKEISDTYNVILINYILSYTDEQENISYYCVEEYYRVRMGIERIHVLNFERTVEEVFSGEEDAAVSSDLVLGIRSEDVDYLVNDTGTILCFEQAGDLWTYNTDSGLLTRIYSFRSEDEPDVRENYGEHDIRLIQMDETGSVDFVVCGYMNRGTHEGQVGISVNRYDSTTSTVEELAFFPTPDSYQVLSSEIKEEMYLTSSNILYLIRADCLYRIDLRTKKTSIENAEMTQDNHVGSADGRYLAWTEGSLSTATTLYLMDLETGRTAQIDAPEGYLIRPLGFLDEDCVYGLAEQSDVAAEDYLFPMSQVEVVDFSGSNLTKVKTYDAEGYYVTGADVRDGTICLTRMKRENGRLVEADEDIIYNREMQDEALVTASDLYVDVKETLVTLHLPVSIRAEVDTTEAKLIRTEETTVNLFADRVKKDYYVYARGEIALSTASRAEAEALAEEIRGVVVARDQTCVWNMDLASEE